MIRYDGSCGKWMWQNCGTEKFIAKNFSPKVSVYFPLSVSDIVPNIELCKANFYSSTKNKSSNWPFVFSSLSHLKDKSFHLKIENRRKFNLSIIHFNIYAVAQKGNIFACQRR